MPRAKKLKSKEISKKKTTLPQEERVELILEAKKTIKPNQSKSTISINGKKHRRSSSSSGSSSSSSDDDDTDHETDASSKKRKKSDQTKNKKNVKKTTSIGDKVDCIAINFLPSVKRDKKS